MIRTLLEFSRRHSLAVIIAAGVITVLFGISLINLEVDPDITHFLPDDEESTLLMEKYGNGLGENFLVVAVEAADPFTLEGLSSFSLALEELQELPEIDPGMTPFNLITFAKDGKRLGFEPLSPGGKAPKTREELSLLKQKLIETPYARNLIISDDQTALYAVFPVKETDNYTRLMTRIDEIISTLTPYYRIHTSGTIPFMKTTEEYLSKDLTRLLLFALLLILITFYLGFRAMRAVLLPVMIVLMGTVWSLGFMSLCGFSLTTISVIIPPLVLALGSSYSIHILNQYYREAGSSRGDNRWITSAIVHVNRTILLASLTTIAGLMSLLAVSMGQTREFAFTTSFGILACAVLSLFFFPAVLYRLRSPKPKQTKQVLEGFLTRSMIRLSGIALRGRYVFLASFILLSGVFAYSVRKIEYNTDAMSYFPDNAAVVRDMRFFTRTIGGFEEISITLTAPDAQKNYFLDTAALKMVARFENSLKELPDVSYISSFVQYLKYLNQVMYGTFAIPEKRAPILFLSKYLKLAAAGEARSGLLRTLANEDFSSLTVTLRVYNSSKGAFIDETRLKDLMEDLDERLADVFPPEITVERWGTTLRYLALSDILQRDSIKSMLIAAAAILMITSVFFRSLPFGLYSLVPLATGLMLNLSFMVIAKIPLDMITIMVSSIAIGVGVDDSIHFLIQFRKQLSENPQNIRDAIGNTMKLTGRPIVLTTFSIIAGLLILSLAAFKPIVYFGLLVVFTLAATCLGTVVILPAILSLSRRRAR